MGLKHVPVGTPGSILVFVVYACKGGLINKIIVAIVKLHLDTLDDILVSAVCT